jgi:hypothetical protein
MNWKLLYRVTFKNLIISEVMAAACLDGAGVIARWTRRLNPDGTVSWKVEEMNTESGEGMRLITDFDDEERVPATPPAYLFS